MKKVVKQEQKELAQLIKELKSKRKGSAYGYVDGLLEAQDKYRRKHVAYCMFFNNTSYEAIETNPNVPLVEGYYSPWFIDWEGCITKLWKKGESHEKDVCLSA